MTGVGYMIFVASAAFATLACQGCASLQSLHAGPGGNNSGIAAKVTEPAAPLSKGMMLAAPSAYGAGAMSAANAAIPARALPAPKTTTIYTALLPGPLPEEADLFNLAITSGPNLNPLAAGNWSSSPGLLDFTGQREAARLLPASEVEKDFTAEFAFAANHALTGLGFDIGLAPRLSYTEEGRFKTRSFGGEVRIGQNFDERGTHATSDSWYIFAGSDGEALVWDTGANGFSSIYDSIKLRDQVTVGDIQAGFSIQRGPGQFSLSYIRREVSYSERGVGTFKTNEDFAGLSFTLRR